MDACTVLGAGHFVHEEMVLSFRILIVSLMCYEGKGRGAERTAGRDPATRERERAAHSGPRSRSRVGARKRRRETGDPGVRGGDVSSRARTEPRIPIK